VACFDLVSRRTQRVFELVFRYPDRKEVVPVSKGTARTFAVGAMLTTHEHTWLIERTEDVVDPPKRRFICIRRWED